MFTRTCTLWVRPDDEPLRIRPARAIARADTCQGTPDAA
jgi:hypothetical protein